MLVAPLRTSVIIATLVTLVGIARAEAPPPKPRVLVLPLAPTRIVDLNAARAFDARLLVALDDTKRIQTLTHDEEQECTTLPCLAQLGARTGAAYVLSLAAVPEGQTVTLFGTLVDVKTATAWRRIELPRVQPAMLAKAPAELVPQILGTTTNNVAPIVTFARPANASVGALTFALHDHLVALRAFKVIPLDGVDRSPPTHRVDVTITDLTIGESRPAICKWFEGSFAGTLSVTELSTGRVVWSKPVVTTASKRVHFSSRAEITDMMLGQAVIQWMDAFRAEGVLRPRR
jgi:hypothetical protein